jgi:hypothetical protein
MKTVDCTRDGITVWLSNSELDIVIAGMRETLEEMKAWEFETRVGFSPETVRQLLAAFLMLPRDRS